MYGSFIFGTHQATLEQQQIAGARQVFSAAVRANTAILARSGGLHQTYEYGTHELAIRQQQATSASYFIRSLASFPQFPILGLKRDFPTAQQEEPIDLSPWCSTAFLRTRFLIPAVIQSPMVSPALTSFPQYPLDQLGSELYQAPPPPAFVPPAFLLPVFMASPPQEATIVQWNGSDTWEPIGQTGPIAIALVAPTIIGLEDPGVDPTTLLGTAFLRWSAVAGASAYRVYINGVPQPGTVTGQFYQANGLVVGEQYIFGVVATAAGIDDSPLSNEIYYEHGSNEFSVVYKYPWGNIYKTGYVLVVKLGTPE